MLHTKFQASKPSGSEEEDFLIFFYVFIWLEPLVVVVVVALLFYVHGKHLRSCRDRQLT